MPQASAASSPQIPAESSPAICCELHPFAFRRTLFMSFPAEFADGFSNLSRSLISVYPRRARWRAVEEPIVPPPPTIRILLSFAANGMLSVSVRMRGYARYRGVSYRPEIIGRSRSFTIRSGANSRQNTNDECAVSTFKPSANCAEHSAFSSGAQARRTWQPPPRVRLLMHITLSGPPSVALKRGRNLQRRRGAYRPLWTPAFRILAARRLIRGTLRDYLRRSSFRAAAWCRDRRKNTSLSDTKRLVFPHSGPSTRQEDVRFGCDRDFGMRAIAVLPRDGARPRGKSTQTTIMVVE